MNICIVFSTPWPPEEGIGNYVYNLSMKLAEKGHKVTVITRGSSKTERKIINDVEVIKAPFFPAYPFHVQLHGIFVNKIFSSMEPSFDIVHIHTPLSPLIRTSLPIITTVHTPMLTDGRSIEKVNLRSGIMHARFISYPLEMKLIKRSDMITAVSNSVAQELEEYGLYSHEVVVIGNGVDENLFVPIQIKNKERYILYTGRLSYRKGLFDFIKCGIMVCAKYTDIKFKLTGKGPLKDKLKNTVAESGFEDRFEFLGHVDKSKLIELYQNATIFILPSHYEGLPTTLLEAMSCGLPIVATAVSGNLDVVESGKNGILVPVKSPDKMAEAISSLLENENLRKELGIAARRTIEDKFTWDSISDKILKCYYSILQRE
jgi:glycosyltransferase involved in cell wall biosynthesis